MKHIAGLVGNRILQLLPVELGVSFIVFSLMSLLPGNAAVAILGPDASTAQVVQVSHQLGLDKPFFYRYGSWVWHALQGNLGTSLLNHQSVMSIIVQRLPVTVEIMIFAYVISLGLAVPVAVLAARRPRGIVDTASRALSTLSLSVPGFVIALLLIILFAVKLGMLPAEGYVPLSQGIGSNLKSFLLPSVTVSLGLFAAYSRILRSDLLEQLESQDYVLTARAKGVGEWRVLIFHAMKNSLFALITVVGTNFGYLIGGVVVVENIFGLPGMGQLMQYSILNRDYTVVQGEVIVIATAVILVNLLTDIAYLYLDPRVRYGSSGN